MNPETKERVRATLERVASRKTPKKPTKAGSAGVGQVALEDAGTGEPCDPSELVGIKFEGLDVNHGPTKDEWLDNLVLLRVMFQVLKYDDEGLAEREGSSEDLEVWEEITEKLFVLKDRMDGFSELAETALARIVASLSRVSMEGDG